MNRRSLFLVLAIVATLVVSTGTASAHTVVAPNAASHPADSSYTPTALHPANCATEKCTYSNRNRYLTMVLEGQVNSSSSVTMAIYYTGSVKGKSIPALSTGEGVGTGAGTYNLALPISVPWTSLPKAVGATIIVTATIVVNNTTTDVMVSHFKLTK